MDKLSELIKQNANVNVAIEENEDKSTVYTLTEAVDLIKGLIKEGISVKLYHVIKNKMSINAEDMLEQISEDLSCNENLEDWELQYDTNDIQALQYILNSILRKNEGNNYYFEFGDEIEIDLKEQEPIYRPTSHTIYHGSSDDPYSDNYDWMEHSTTHDGGLNDM